MGASAAEVVAIGDAIGSILGLAGRCRVIDKYNLRKNVEGLAVVFRKYLADAA